MAPRGKRQSQGHRGHRTYRIQKVGSFCGRRLVTSFLRCETCGGELVATQQYPVKRGQHA